MELDMTAEKAEAHGTRRSHGSALRRSAGRFRLALDRTRPYILAAGALYVGAFLITFIIVLSLPEPVRDSLISPGERWVLRQPVVQQPLDLNVGFADWVYVFRHNVVAGLMWIATAGLPGILINAYRLSESAAAFHAAGKAAIFWALILPHGLLEISASCVATGVGLRFGRSLLARMRHRADPGGGVRASLADGIVLILGLFVPASAVAALIEVELTTMWMPLPLAILFGAFAAATFVTLILGISGPEPGTTAVERGSTVDDQDASPAEEDASGEEISEEDVASARTVLRDIAWGGPALDLVLKPAPRDARAACVRLVTRGQRAPDPITAALAAGLARRYLSRPKNQALWIAYVLSLSLLVALAGAPWVGVIGLWILGAALTLRTRGRVKRSEQVNRELVDQALRGEDPTSMPPSSSGFEAAFHEAIEAKTPLQTASRLHVF
jgi:uncharacterized membrane protein SpoIIM required for sporulation